MTLERRLLLLLVPGTEMGLVAVAFAVSPLFGVSPVAALQWNVTELLVGIGLSLPMLAVFVITLRCRSPWLCSTQQLLTTSIAPLFANCTWYDRIGIAVVAGVGEEILFRGTLQLGLAQWLGEWGSLVVVALLFGLCHSMSTIYFIFATIAGMVFGSLVVGDSNLLAAVTAHAVYDAGALLYLANAATDHETPT